MTHRIDLAARRRAAWGSWSRRRTVRKPMVTSAGGGVVVAQHPAAAEAGARVLAEGGNAVDAAIAAGLCLGVVEPWMSGPGGGGLMLAHMAGQDTPGGATEARTIVIDGAMVAPAALDPARYPVMPGTADGDLFGWPAVAEARNLMGGAAVAVPGLIDLYRVALETLGTRPWADLVAPAIALADQGLLLDAPAAQCIAAEAPALERFAASVAAFLPEGRPFLDARAGRRLPQTVLAGTLRRLAAEGPRAFYEGAPAEALVRATRATGGSLSRRDLAGYRAQVRVPQTADYRGTTVVVAPELNGGPSVLLALEALATLCCGGSQPPGPETYRAYAEALRLAFVDRLTRMGDCHGRRGLPSDAARESCTSHVSVADGDGNLVALTQTLLSVFGSRLVAPEAGVLLNNGLYWFDPRLGRPNAMAPGKRPLCNYAPALVLTHGGGLAVGAAGGRRTIGAVTQLISFLIDHGMDLEEAIHQPRIDVSDPDRVTADARLCLETLEALAGETGTLDIQPPEPFPTPFAIPGLAQRKAGRSLGAADPLHPWAEAVRSDEASR
ncbi:gamma-glutamyltransferase family protein [Roseospira visakhapatnamensis]|uniref:Gamma-glutamyltranspeptidase/glutathione hydrolase n=1 Tax=Roseospira visakhapatnamensis TaxID=390880 RepID=A0A7W6WBB9_9PROT|nr:gamma-glutamyltransferase [Roseospira visakhapatnamensis]MBB4268175.1 gamma-glutamyltranspeptidase/glutathione hydrolase [Roseospira visakhapatnamensis]